MEVRRRGNTGESHGSSTEAIQSKAKIALEAIKGQKTANKITTEYGVHPTQIAQWKKQALNGLPDVTTQWVWPQQFQTHW